MFLPAALFGLVILNGFVLSSQGWAAAQPITQEPSTLSVGNVLSNKESVNPYHFYTFRQDYRKCLAPLCGGIFVKSVNKKVTHCPDGSVQTECYVALVLSKPKIELSSARLLQGTLLSKSFTHFSALPVMRLKQAYRSASSALSAGVFVMLKDNGIRCVTTPCFATDSYYLNKHKVRAVSAFDLSAVGAAEDLLTQALTAYGQSAFIVASGKYQVAQPPQNEDVTFIAQQFYLPISP